MAASLAARCLGGDFVNLDFMDPDVPPETLSRYGREPASKVFRGWQLLRNEIAYDQVVYYGGAIGEAVQLAKFDAFALPNDGKEANPFTVDLVAGPALWDYLPYPKYFDWFSLELRQTGTVPADATTFTFYSLREGPAFYGPDVFLEHEGRLIGLPWEVDPPVRGEGFAYDVSGYRGQELTIRIRASGYSGGAVKIVGFSSVPEPGTAALLVLGGAGFWWLAGSGRRRGGPKLCGAPARETRR